jgi:K+/H+ antiporter YhaU regulatory subunit KhtT
MLWLAGLLGGLEMQQWGGFYDGTGGVIALRIAESTVKSNINRILSKLGAKDRTQATIIALKRGIAIL